MHRRHFLSHLTAAASVFPSMRAEAKSAEAITVETIAEAEKLAGLTFNPAQREMMVEDLNENLDLYRALRETPIPNSLEPALVFDPAIGGDLPRAGMAAMQWKPTPLERPSANDDLAFMGVGELSHLLRSRQITSQELTRLSLSRLRTFDPLLQVVVTLTEERAMERAAAADRELDAGAWRGPLHGIPYGAKDLLAVRGYRTTWGAVPFRNQVIDHDAAVVEKLDAAGAVLVAKLSLGALAWGDVWFGGMTKNPWNVEQGSSGSSAGPGSAVSAGLVPFAIGSETLGSIVSPATRNGITGHRPTFGTVSRYGAMTL
ncbi:MAG: amidase, partial [Rhodothermales bacterium]